MRMDSPKRVHQRMTKTISKYHGRGEHVDENYINALSMEVEQAYETYTLPT